jgi:hypothetical protein
MENIKKFIEDFGTELKLNESKQPIQKILEENYLVTFENKSYFIPKNNYFYGDEEESMVKFLRENSK